MSEDIKRLKKEIERLKNAIKKQRYGLVWMDVPEAFEDDVENKLPILKEVPDLAIKNNDGKPTHILIEGDNYHALTCLNYTHKGEIDVIYIDPPYNTGSDGFRYSDKRILDKFPDGTEVPKDHPFRHSYWLSFMKKRIELARELLSPKGVLMISIDQNELANLKLLCDQVMKGERYMLGLLSVINNLKGRSDDKYYATANEFLLVYAKDLDNAHIKGFKLTDSELEEYIDKDEISEYKPISLRKTGKSWQREHRPFMFYPVFYSPKNKKVVLPTPAELKRIYNSDKKTFNDRFLNWLGRKYKKLGYHCILPKDKNGIFGRWRWGIPTFIDNLTKSNVVIKSNSNGGYGLYEKMRPSIGDIQRTITPKTIFYKPEYDTGSAGRLIKQLFGKEIFENPKSLYYIKDILKISTERDSIVLDFFAGSGTTGHAIFALNQEDSGRRQSILVTNNENKIAEEVCYPRIMKVIKGYKDRISKQWVEGLGGSIRYYKTDFIGTHNIRNASDEDAIELAYHAGEMLAIAENTLDQIEKDNYTQLFTDGERYTAVYFREELNKFDKFLKKVEKLNKPTTVYVFSWGNEEFTDDFVGMDHVKVKTIPQPILEIYKQIYNLGIE